MKYFPILILFIVFIGSSCKTSKKTASTEIPGRTLPALPTSLINIPIKVNMRPLLAIMDTMTSKEFTNEKWPDYTESSCDFRYKYRFLRSPFTF